MQVCLNNICHELCLGSQHMVERMSTVIALVTSVHRMNHASRQDNPQANRDFTGWKNKQLNRWNSNRSHCRRAELAKISEWCQWYYARSLKRAIKSLSHNYCSEVVKYLYWNSHLFPDFISCLSPWGALTTQCWSPKTFYLHFMFALQFLKQACSIIMTDCWPEHNPPPFSSLVWDQAMVELISS